MFHIVGPCAVVEKEATKLRVFILFWRINDLGSRFIVLIKAKGQPVFYFKKGNVGCIISSRTHRFPQPPANTLTRLTYTEMAQQTLNNCPAPQPNLELYSTKHTYI